jgi:hypothetical protein
MNGALSLKRLLLWQFPASGPVREWSGGMCYLLHSISDGSLPISFVCRQPAQWSMPLDLGISSFDFDEICI